MVNRNPPKRYVTASPRFPALLSGLIKACQDGMGLMGPKIHHLISAPNGLPMLPKQASSYFLCKPHLFGGLELPA
jgi:hypothetical protein